MDLKETDILGDTINDHWYYRSKAKAMLQLLERVKASSVLDVGAGSCFFSKYLLTQTEIQEAWCVDISYASDADATVGCKPLHRRKHLDTVDADLILLMDVLEHIDNDLNLLLEYKSKVAEGSKFLISVPAFQFLWSSHDVYLEHKRRYTISQLQKLVLNAGLTPIHCSYYFGAVFPLALATRIFSNILFKNKIAKSQLKTHSKVTNLFLSSLCYAEIPFMRWNRFAGLTVFCLASKGTP